MNPSEIAERAARREKFSAWYKANYLKIAGVSSWVERAWAAYEAGAIEESRGQPVITVSHGAPPGVALAHSAYVMNNMNSSLHKLQAGEPSSAPPAKPTIGGAYTGLRDGCTAHPSGLCECGVEGIHKLCVCADCGSNWPNPEWRSGAAQEVSPAK